MLYPFHIYNHFCLSILLSHTSFYIMILARESQRLPAARNKRNEPLQKPHYGPFEALNPANKKGTINKSFSFEVLSWGGGGEDEGRERGALVCSRVHALAEGAVQRREETVLSNLRSLRFYFLFILFTHFKMLYICLFCFFDICV